MIKENTFPDGNVGGERKAGGKDEEEAMMALEYPPVITYLHNRNRCRANKKISLVVIITMDARSTSHCIAYCIFMELASTNLKN